MDNIYDYEDPDGAEMIYGNLNLAKKEVQQPRTMKQRSEIYSNLNFTKKKVKKRRIGCLPRISHDLLQLLISLSLFLGLIIVLVQVFRVHQSLESCTQGKQKNLSSVGVSWEQKQYDLNKISQLMVQLNVTLERLCPPCPWGWEPFQGNCYWLSRSRNDWFDASSACEQMKAKLVIINSKEEEEFLQFWDIRYGKRTWIGLTDHQTEGSWKWVDETPLIDSYWKPGEPNGTDNEDCVELLNDGWNDCPCTLELAWICEKPALPCP